MRSTGITFRYSHELSFPLKSNAREKNQYFAHIKASCFKPKKYVSIKEMNFFTILHTVASSTLIVSKSPKLITLWHSSILDMPIDGVKKIYSLHLFHTKEKCFGQLNFKHQIVRTHFLTSFVGFHSFYCYTWDLLLFSYCFSYWQLLLKRNSQTKESCLLFFFLLTNTATELLSSN